MKRLCASLALVAAILATGIGTVAANAAPQRPIIGYTATGEIHTYPVLSSCLVATAAQNNAPVKTYPCGTPDALSTWHSILISGIVMVTLAAHPNLYLSGIPGEDGELYLRELPKGQEDPPLNALLALTGRVRPGMPNGLRNTAREMLTIPPHGYSLYWLPPRIKFLFWSKKFVWGTNVGGHIIGGWLPEYEK